MCLETEAHHLRPNMLPPPQVNHGCPELQLHQDDSPPTNTSKIMM
jgi:hypothetical protein